jgi:predicted transcriptional regulator
MTAPHQRTSETSREAAERIAPAAPTLRDRVLGVLRAAGLEGLTDEEITLRLGMSPSTQRPRRIELVAAGLVRDSGRTRHTASGRRATVWIATPRQLPLAYRGGR